MSMLCFTIGVPASDGALVLSIIGGRIVVDALEPQFREEHDALRAAAETIGGSSSHGCAVNRRTKSNVHPQERISRFLLLAPRRKKLGAPPPKPHIIG